jgi:hypothetical protein
MSKTFKWVVYDGEARYEKHLVKLVCEQHKNFSYSNSIKISNILWFGKHLFPQDIELWMKIKGFVNRVPGAELFREKHTQWMILNQLHDLFPEEFSFHPKSFCLPRDEEALKDSIKAHPKKLLIAKPSEGGGGGGIFLFKSTKDLSGMTWAKEWVVQRYVDNPLLISKKKWDMRVYVLIHGINPMKAYLATDCGLARFWTNDYDTSDPNNIYSHLTNYSLNKNSDRYIKDQVVDEDAETNNTKLSIEETWRIVKKQYPEVDIEADWKQKMRDVVVNVLSATRSTMELRYFEMTGFKDTKHSSRFYQILGFDIMFDSDFNAWLFEVNAYPSMDIFYHKDMADGTYNKDKSEIDERVKSKVFYESAKIIISKQESDIFELVYDSSEESSPHCSLYESVFEIYKKVSGVKLGQTITISKFSKLAQYLPKSFGVTKIDLELLFKRLQHMESSNIGLIPFFTALNALADKHSIDVVELVDSIVSSIG